MSERIERILTTRQLSAFLKSDQAEASRSEKTARETTDAVKRTENAIRETTACTEGAIQKTTDVLKATQDEILQQGQKLSSFTLVTNAFLPLSFATSVFYLLSVM